MLNALKLIRSIPAAKIFEIDGLVFAQFSCPPQDQPVVIWAEMDYLVHVISGTTSWKFHGGLHTAYEGESVFFKKGAHIMPEHHEENVCIQIYFIPDEFVRETVFEFASALPAIETAINECELTIRVNNDVGLSAFFQAMSIYFTAQFNPPEMLLRLKLKELVATILTGKSNPELSAYLHSIAASDSPSIPAVMERNFYHNLPIEAFAKMCNRSVSSFKREFQKIYGISPGRWLLERRLKQSASLLESTGFSVTEIALECGFEDMSHFSKTFKELFGTSPSIYREERSNIPT